MEESFRKLKSLLNFYYKNKSKIELKFLDRRRVSVVGYITKINYFFNRYIVLRSNNGTLMKIFLEDINDSSIVPIDFMKKEKESRNPINPKLRYEVLKRDRFKCRYCGAKGKYVKLEVDHIIPVSRGGTDDIDNLRTSCFKCNRGKGDRI